MLLLYTKNAYLYSQFYWVHNSEKGENIFQFYPNCRIRFLRYNGAAEQVGTKINIIKDINLEYPLLKIIEKAKEFTALNQTTGRFQIVPEFAWLEGIVNAVTHREYGMTGS